MSERKRYQYCNSLLAVAESTLAQKHKANLTTYMGESKKFMSERLKNIMKPKNKRAIILSAVIICLIGTICSVSLNIYADNGSQRINFEEALPDALTDGGNNEQNNVPVVNEGKEFVLNIQDYYITNTGDPSNLYYIDENKVLWGCGRNNCGQLGQGTQDYEFHEEMVKIAENVIHVDYSQMGFTIYITDEHKLYGIGNAGCGALQQYDEFSSTQYINGEHYFISTPCLLMENVIYARCGRSDIVCMTEDSSVWIWGTIGFDGNPYNEACFEPKPVKVLENAALVTGGLYNHAALLTDGSVWTWGYNYAGSCGVFGETVVSTPTLVAEDVAMVWTGSIKYNVDCYDISEFDGVYERGMENTVILKQDGSYWACGVNIGDEEITLDRYWETSDYPIVCERVSSFV